LLHEVTDNGFSFSTDKRKLDLKYIHQFLSTKSYWAEGISLALVERSVENSSCFGVYHDHKQVGFARVITDFSTFGYLADVFIDESYRGKGLSKKLMQFIFSLEELKILRRVLLGTKDAHGLYEQFGFKLLKAPDRFMELHRPDIYKR
jgi:GNAT superfamily N-acetyltransferase